MIDRHVAAYGDCMSDEEILLRLDRTTARYLLGALDDLGEHLAAGVPIGPMSSDENERLGKLIRELRRSLKQTSQ